MGKSYAMHWIEATRRWRKRWTWRKNRYERYYPALDGESKASSYDRCYALWLADKAKIEAKDDPQHQAVSRLLSLIDGEKLSWVVEALGGMSKDSLDYFAKKVEMSEELTTPKVNASEPTGTRPGTFGALTAEYLAERLANVRVGQGSAGRVETIRSALRYATELFGEDAGTEVFHNGILSKYRLRLLEVSTRDKVIGMHTCDTYLKVLKQFCKWAFHAGKIEVRPRELDARITIRKPKRVPNIPTIEEFKVILSEAPEFLRACLIVMANCGMYQGDLSALRPSELDLRNRTITRSREKNKHHPDSPVTTYKLWDETVKVIRRWKSKSTENVFLRVRGSLLKNEYLDDNGRRKRSDFIGLNWGKLMKRLTEEKKLTKKYPVKSLRKLGADRIAKIGRNADFAKLYRSAPPEGVQEESYVTPDQERFEAALLQLGRELGLHGQVA